jgi:MSHA biogenesis protein MshQ
VFDVLPSAAKFARLISSAKVVPDGPYESSTVGLRLTDALDARAIQASDLNTSPSTAGACTPTCTDTMLGSGFKFRFGRLRLDDAFGPETHPLLVNFATEYWTGNYFAVNTSDSCTLVPRSAITYPAGAISTDANRTVSLTGGTTQGTYSSINATNVLFGVSSPPGTAGQQFTSPNGGTGRFVVGVNLTSLPWLRFDWNQDGDYSDISLPNASFEFGSYRGNDRIIYWREKLQ